MALDCEMVELSGGGDAVVQVCVVDKGLRTKLLTYVRPIGGEIVDYRTQYSGVRPGDLVGAPELSDIRRKLRDLLRGRIVVGHSVRNDLLRLLDISHPEEDIRDSTSELPKFMDTYGWAPAQVEGPGVALSRGCDSASRAQPRGRRVGSHEALPEALGSAGNGPAAAFAHVPL